MEDSVGSYRPVCELDHPPYLLLDTGTAVCGDCCGPGWLLFRSEAPCLRATHRQAGLTTSEEPPPPAPATTWFQRRFAVDSVSDLNPPYFPACRQAGLTPAENCRVDQAERIHQQGVVRSEEPSWPAPCPRCPAADLWVKASYKRGYAGFPVDHLPKGTRRVITADPFSARG